MHAGMSSVMAQEDIFRVMYLIFLTMDTYAFYIFFEKDISFATYGASDAKFSGHLPDEPRLPIKLSSYYGFCRTHLLKFRLEFACWVILGLLNGFFIWFFYYGVLTENGGMLDNG
jgi:hypothetical protein